MLHEFPTWVSVPRPVLYDQLHFTFFCVAESLLPTLIYGWHRIVHHIGKDLNIVSADHVVHQSALFSSPIPSPSAVTSRSASWAQLSRSGSIFVSSASRCFAWELRRNNGPCSGFESIDSMKTDELNTKQPSQWNVQQARLDDPQSSKAYCHIAFRSNPSWDTETWKNDGRIAQHQASTRSTSFDSLAT